MEKIIEGIEFHNLLEKIKIKTKHGVKSFHASFNNRQCINVEISYEEIKNIPEVLIKLGRIWDIVNSKIPTIEDPVTTITVLL